MIHKFGTSVPGIADQKTQTALKNFVSEFGLTLWLTWNWDNIFLSDKTSRYPLATQWRVHVVPTESLGQQLRGLSCMAACIWKPFLCAPAVHPCFTFTGACCRHLQSWINRCGHETMCWKLLFINRRRCRSFDSQWVAFIPLFPSHLSSFFICCWAAHLRSRIFHKSSFPSCGGCLVINFPLSLSSAHPFLIHILTQSLNLCFHLSAAAGSAEGGSEITSRNNAYQVISNAAVCAWLVSHSACICNACVSELLGQ